MITVFSELHRLRDAKTELHFGELVAPFECPRRMDIVLERVRESGLGEIVAPQEFGLEPVLRVHDKGFVDFLATHWQEWLDQGESCELIPSIWPSRSMPQLKVPEAMDGKIGYYALAGETSLSAGTWEAANASKDVALSATKRLLDERLNGIFAMCRPPGHHASTDQYGGYCFLNNAAIAAQYLRDNGKAKVAVLDVDFHHGNGTQEIFYERDDVLFVSLHGEPEQAFPHFLGYAEERGAGAGDGYNLNLPLPPGTPYDKWSAALEQGMQKITEFAADALVISLGVDTFENDPISFFKLSNDDYLDMGAKIRSLNLPTVFIMEGGYAVDDIGVNVVNTLLGFEQAGK